MSKLTAAQRLVEIKYMYYIPAMYHKSIDEHQTCGVFSSGSHSLDKTFMSQPVVTNGCILEMADKYSEGVPITLYNPKDSVPIYKTISKILSLWLEASLKEHNLTIPIDDLRLLDDFAKPIADLARRYDPALYRNRTDRDDLEKTLTGFFNARRYKKKVQTETQTEENKKPLYVHNPLLNSIKQNLNERGLKWS